MVYRILKIVVIVLALFYSVPRFSALWNLRYDRVVVQRLEQFNGDDTEHIRRHQEFIDKEKPEALKGVVAFFIAVTLTATVFRKKVFSAKNEER